MAEEKFRSLLQRSREGLSEYRAPPAMKDIAHKDPKDDISRLFIIACSDSRVDPAAIFKLNPGEAIVIRVAGARVDESVLKSLEIMGTLVKIGMIVLIHHSDCGGLFTTDEEIASRLSDRAPDKAHLVEGKYFGTFGHIGLDKSIRDDVAVIRNWAFLPKDAAVVGYAYELENGHLREVEAAKL